MHFVVYFRKNHFTRLWLICAIMETLSVITDYCIHFIERSLKFSRPVVFFPQRFPTCNFSSTLYPQSCSCKVQVIHKLGSAYSSALLSNSDYLKLIHSLLTGLYKQSAQY
jgi:hypothetical protein